MSALAMSHTCRKAHQIQIPKQVSQVGKRQEQEGRTDVLLPQVTPQTQTGVFVQGFVIANKVHTVTSLRWAGNRYDLPTFPRPNRDGPGLKSSCQKRFSSRSSS